MPCRNCEDRHIGCHGTCEKYIDWKESRIQKCRERYERKEADSQYMGLARATKDKMLHKKKYE